MMTLQPKGMSGFPPPDPAQSVWPLAPQFGSPEGDVSRVGCVRWAAVGLVFGVIGIVGALLPAFDGQKVGDPDSTAFQIGLPVGFLGGAIALALGIICVVRSRNSVASSVLAIVAIVFGGVALLLTAALFASG